MVQLPVFQMKLGLDDSSRPGWLFADEGSDDDGSFAFTIPYLPLKTFEQVELSLAGERAGEFEEFRLRFDGHVFVEDESGVRFALHDMFAPTDFRGLPFAHSFAYIGSGSETLRHYGLSSNTLFLTLTPLDLNRMDEAFIQHRVVSSGTTQSYGRHRHTENVASTQDHFGLKTGFLKRPNYWAAFVHQHGIRQGWATSNR